MLDIENHPCKKSTPSSLHQKKKKQKKQQNKKKQKPNMIITFSDGDIIIIICVTYPYMNMRNVHRMFIMSITHIDNIGIPKHEKHDFLVQVRNFLFPLS